jgi:hypothetical protein
MPRATSCPFTRTTAVAAQKARRYTFAASQGGFYAGNGVSRAPLPRFPQLTSPRVHDPIAAGRSAAARAVAVEVAATGLVAVVFLALDSRHALAAALGGAAMAGGNIAAAAIALAGGIQPAPAAFVRLLLGVLAKWMVVLAVFVLVLAAWRLPPLPALAGLAASTLAYLLALNWTGARAGRANQGKVKRER